MISQKPFLIRALFEWCNENEFTPHIMTYVDEHTQVPRAYVRDEKIVLNIAFEATKDLVIDNQWITFQASFGNSVEDIAIPVANVLAIFAQENGMGMQFDLEDYTPPPQPSAPPPATGPGLKLVK